MYTFRISERAKQFLSTEQTAMLQHMIDSLCKAYEECDHRQEFYMCYFLLQSFRDIIMAWTPVAFSLAYDELSAWQKIFLEGR